jgi:hypothetical protein
MKIRFGIVAGIGFLLAACGGSGSDSGTGVEEETEDRTLDGVSTAILDASDYDSYVYFDLASGAVVALTDAEAALSDQWDIAFRRSTIKLNGGTSGPGAVAAAVVADQADLYDAAGAADASVFLNVTADSELEHLTAQYTAPANLVQDELVSQLQGSGAITGTQMDLGWYWYDFTTHVISVNNANGWLLRSGEGGSYARFRASALSYDPVNGLDVTFDFDVQVSGTTQFNSNAQFLAHVDAAGGEICFDFDADVAVACTGTVWDLKLGVAGRDWYLHSNGGISGDGAAAAFGPIPWADDLEDYNSATFSPDGTAIAFLYSEDSSSGIFESDSWYAYNLTGQHKLHPNYRVYWIDSDENDADTEKYLLQVTGYYSDMGVSGNVSIRWLQVE